MPAFRSGKPRCRLTLSTNVVLGTGTFDVPWDVISRQEGDFVFPAANPGEIEIVRPGSYLVACALRRSAGSGNFTSSVFVNGVLASQLWLFPVSNTTLAHQFSGASVEHLEVGDLLKVRGATSGVTGAFQAAGSFLDLIRVGPDRWT